MKEEYFLNLKSECFPKVSPNSTSDEYFVKKNKFSELTSELDKKDARDNLGITLLIESLREIINSKVIEAGGVPFDLEPSPNSSDSVLSSAVIYNTLLKYITREELNRILNNLSLTPSIVVDAYLSKTSENPVQNKVLFKRIRDLEIYVENLNLNKVGSEELNNYYDKLGVNLIKDELNLEISTTNDNLEELKRDLPDIIGTTKYTPLTTEEISRIVSENFNLYERD